MPDRLAAVLCTAWVALALAASAALDQTRANVTIATGTTQNMNCSRGVCRPVAKDAVLNVSDLAAMLATGDVKVLSVRRAPDIQFAAPLSWTSAARLTLDSYRSIAFQQPISVAGTGALAIATNGGGSRGDFWFENNGHVAFWSVANSLVINGNHYVLVKTLKGLANAIRANPSGYFALAKQHDASKDGVYKNSPVTTYLAGTFEALGNAVAGLTLTNRKDFSNVGLFARIAYGGVVRDLHVENIEIQGGATNAIGAIAGDNWGTIQNVDVTGTVQNLQGDNGPCLGSIVGFNEQYGVVSHANTTAKAENLGWGAKTTGGIAGCNNGTIRFAVATGSVEVDGSSQTIGGLVGQNATTGTILDTYATSDVNSPVGDGIEGGLVGQNLGSISDSAAAGSVGGCIVCGGLVGYSYGTIARSHATGEVDLAIPNGGGGGGLVGVNFSGASISQSYATGAVKGGQQMAIGGLVGEGGGTIQDAYARGSETGTDGSPVGGLLGRGDGSVSRAYSTGMPSGVSGLTGGSIGQSQGGAVDHDYWDLDTSGISSPSDGCGNFPDCSGVMGIADVELKSGLPAGYDPAVWGRKANVNDGYPYLRANPPPR